MFLAHTLMENRSGLLVNFLVSDAAGTAERDGIPVLLDEARGRGFHPQTLGADIGRRHEGVRGGDARPWRYRGRGAEHELALQRQRPLPGKDWPSLSYSRRHGPASSGESTTSEPQPARWGRGN